MTPNNLPKIAAGNSDKQHREQATRDGRFRRRCAMAGQASSAVAVHVTSRRWLIWTLTTRKTTAQGLTRMARIFGARLCAQHQSQPPGWREDIQIFPCQPVVGRAAAGLSDTAALHFRLRLRHAALRRVNPRLKSLRTLGSGLNLRGVSAVEPDALKGVASRQQEKAPLRTEFKPSGAAW